MLLLLINLNIYIYCFIKNYNITSIGNRRPNEWYDREYFVTVKYQVTDLNNPKRKYGVICNGFGSKPIELNVDRELLPTNFFVWEDFDEKLFERLSRTQTSINEEGYYKKDRDTGRVVVPNEKI
jgi:hypothetical protein